MATPWWSRLRGFLRPRGDMVSDLRHPSAWLSSWALGSRTRAGVLMTPQAALSLAIYYACLRNISEDVGKLPLLTYRRLQPRGKERAPRHAAYAVLHDAPNPDMTAMTFREVLTHWALAWGNGYAEIVRNRRGTRLALYPIHPSRVQVRRDEEGDLVYDIYGSGPPVLQNDHPWAVRLPQRDVLHLKGLGPEGYSGYSVAQLAAESLALTQNAERFGTAFFQNGAFFSGVLTHPGRLSDEAMEHLRTSWQERYQGPDNAGKPAILEEGLTWHPLSIPPEQAQFIESRQFQVKEVCLTPDSEVLTLSGPRPIALLRPGDLVLTHRGRWRRVRHVLCRPYSGDVVALQTKSFGSVTVTPNHPVLVQYRKPTRVNRLEDEGAPVWCRAGDIPAPRSAPNGHRSRRRFANSVMPRLTCDEQISRIDLREWAPSAVCVDEDHLRPLPHFGTPIRRWVPTAYPLGWICGLFVADGSTSDHQVIWYLGAHETARVAALQDVLQKCFGVLGTVRVSKDHVARVVVSSRVLVPFFAQFGAHASVKAFPLWCLQQGEAFRQGLLDGVVAGDGGHYNRDTYLRTTSRGLAWQVRLLLWADGINSGLEWSPPHTMHMIRGQSVQQRESWIVRWREVALRRGTLGVQDETVSTAITGVETVPYDGLVYNLEVEEDETYTTLAGVVHNCRWFRMPLHKVQDLENAHYSNIEQQNLEYVTDTLMPWLTRWEQELKRKVFAEDPLHFAEHLVLGLLRGDQASRAQYYKERFGMGTLSPNDIRELESENSIGPEGDLYFLATNNYTSLKQAIRMDATPSEPAIPEPFVPTVPGRNGANGTAHALHADDEDDDTP